MYDFDKSLPNFVQFFKVNKQTGTKKPNETIQNDLVKLKLNKINFK